MSITPDKRPNRSGPGGSRRPVLGLLLVVSMLVGIAGVGGWLFLRDETTGALPGFSRLSEPRPVTALANTSARVESIRVESQDRTLRLTNDGKEWRLTDLGGYPVPDHRVERLLDRLKRMKATHVSNDSGPANTNMGLNRPDGPAGAMTQIALTAENGESLGTLTLGTTISMPGAELKEMTVVRLPDSPEIRLVEGRVEISALPGDWIDSTITDIQPDRLEAMTITAPDGTRLTFHRDEEGNFSVEEGLPPGEEVKAKWVLRDAASSLTDLRFIDVQPASAFQENSEQAELWEARITTRNDIVYRVHLKKDETKAWGRFEAIAENAEAKAKASRFNEQHSDWAYLLNQYAANQFTLRPRDLLRQE